MCKNSIKATEKVSALDYDVDDNRYIQSVRAVFSTQQYHHHQTDGLQAQTESSEKQQQVCRGTVWMWSVENVNYSCANGASIILAAVCRCDHRQAPLHPQQHPQQHRHQHLSPSISLQSDVCCHSHTSTDQKITETQHVFRRKSHASDQIWTLYQTRTSQAQTQPENHSFTCNFLFFL